MIGMGYVGIVTAASLASIGHRVTCLEKNEKKLELLVQGKSPIFEPGLEEMIKRGLKEERLRFFSDPKEGLNNAEIIYLTVGTPTLENGLVNLDFLYQAIEEIASTISRDVVVVTKSTVPAGTNHDIKERLLTSISPHLKAEVVSNPEFLREGSAVLDTFHGDRIVIGADNEDAANLLIEVNQPFGIPIIKTDIKSAEMIKYAANAFLAAKISFINEIASICEKVGADVESVSRGMGMDHRIGPHFLNAGIGYGGSCFPKDTRALNQIAANVDHDFHLLKAVIEVNNKQQGILLKKAAERFGDLSGKRAAILGLTFKPNTDDMREAPSITITKELLNNGAKVTAYDPIAGDNAKNMLPDNVKLMETIETALHQADMVFILTEWDEIKEMDLQKFIDHMNSPVIFDGRNCFSLAKVKKYPLEYHSIGRELINNLFYPKKRNEIDLE